MPTLYAPPAVPIFPAGYAPQPADFNNWVQAPFGFLTQNIVFRAEMHTGTSITANTQTTIDYDTVIEDPYSGWNASNFWWTAPYTGWYQVTETTMVTASNNNIRSIIVLTGNVYQNGACMLTNTTGQGGTNGAAIVPMIAGIDHIQVAVFMSTGSSLATGTQRYSSLDITFVSQGVS